MRVYGSLLKIFVVYVYHLLFVLFFLLLNQYLVGGQCILLHC